MKTQEFLNLVVNVVDTLPETHNADVALLKRVAPLFQNGINCSNCIHSNVVYGTEYCRKGTCEKFNQFEPKGSID